MATVAFLTSAGICCQETGVRNTSDWTKPRRVPSAAYTCEEPTPRIGCSNLIFGAELATFRTYATAAIVPMIAAPTNTQLPINRMRVGPARLCARRRFRACRDISAISETTLPVVISWHLLRGALPATCLAT